MPDIINFNGTTYNSIDDMPPDVRRMYAQVQGVLTDGTEDGLPDLLEGLVSSAGARALTQELSSFVIKINGQAYQSLDQMPPEARAKYAQYQAQFDANRNGLPDALETLLGQMGATPGMPSAAVTMSAAEAADAPAFAASAPIAPGLSPQMLGSTAGRSVISPEGGDNRMRLALIAVAALALLACALTVVVVWALMR